MPLEPTIHSSVGLGTRTNCKVYGQSAACRLSAKPSGTGTCHLPTRATTPRVPAGTPASTGMVVVATVPAQTVLAVVRLAKCGPWHRGGWDPIPERGEKTREKTSVEVVRSDSVV